MPSNTQLKQKQVSELEMELYDSMPRAWRDKSKEDIDYWNDLKLQFMMGQLWW